MVVGHPVEREELVVAGLAMAVAVTPATVRAFILVRKMVFLPHLQCLEEELEVAKMVIMVEVAVLLGMAGMLFQGALEVLQPLIQVVVVEVLALVMLVATAVPATP